MCSNNSHQPRDGRASAGPVASGLNRALTRRRLAATGGALSVMAAFGRAWAAPIPEPTEKPTLIVGGRISNTNMAGQAAFDRPMLEALGMHTIETSTPWYSGKVRFEGVLMHDLMQRVGAAGERIEAVALNDFPTEIPIADFSRFGVLLALKRDGHYMPVRDKGPLFIVYPYDTDPELRSQKYYGRSAWQISKVIVK